MKPIKVDVNSKNGTYSVIQVEHNPDVIIDEYKDKIFLLPSIEDDGLGLIRFYFNDIPNAYTEIFKVHLLRFVNFWHFIQYIINTLNVNGDVNRAVHEYFNTLENYLITNCNMPQEQIVVCPCCGSKLLLLENREYCINANCAQFDFYSTLCKKILLLTKNTYNPNKRFLKKLVEVQIPKIQSLTPIDSSAFLSLNLQQILLTLIFQYPTKKLTKTIINSLSSIRIDVIFQLFKIPNTIAEDVYNYLYSTIIPYGSNVYDDIQRLRSIIYQSKVNGVVLTGIMDIDKYIYHAFETNSAFLDSLFYLKTKLTKS